MTERRKLIIDRSLWLHGHGGSDETVLLNNYGQKCCLGFAAEQLCAAVEYEIIDEPTPDVVPTVFLRGLPELINQTIEADDHGNTRQVYLASDLCEKLLEINDSDDYPDIDAPDREKHLIEAFATIGVDVEFTGEYNDGTRASW